jgi:hypothetical protein
VIASRASGHASTGAIPTIGLWRYLSSYHVNSSRLLFFDCKEGLEGLVLGNILSHHLDLLVLQLDNSFFQQTRDHPAISV